MGDDPDQSALSEGKQIVFLELEEVKEQEFHINSLYSTLPPDKIMMTLVGRMRDKGQHYAISNKSWQVQVTLLRDLSDSSSSAEL